jgi:hypothetical protein
MSHAGQRYADKSKVNLCYDTVQTGDLPVCNMKGLNWAVEISSESCEWVGRRQLDLGINMTELIYGYISFIPFLSCVVILGWELQKSHIIVVLFSFRLLLATQQSKRDFLSNSSWQTLGTTHLQLVLRLRMSRAVPLIPEFLLSLEKDNFIFTFYY